jgi:hypothetical protein
VLLVVFVEKRSSKCLKKISININILQALKKFLLRICKKIDDYEKSKSKRNINDELLFVSLRDDGFYLNHIKIIDKKSELQIAILKILIEHYKNEISSGSNFLPISKISFNLRKMGIESFNLENQIRTSIHRIRKITSSKNIIDSSKWHGYRFGDHVFIERKNKQM